MNSTFKWPEFKLNLPYYFSYTTSPILLLPYYFSHNPILPLLTLLSHISEAILHLLYYWKAWNMTQFVHLSADCFLGISRVCVAVRRYFQVIFKINIVSFMKKSGRTLYQILLQYTTSISEFDMFVSLGYCRWSTS